MVLQHQRDRGGQNTMSANIESTLPRGSAGSFNPCAATEMEGARVAVVVKCWPRLSETFIAQEMAGLEARGLKLAIYSLRHPTDSAIHPAHARVRASIAYLPQYLKDD